MLFLDESGTAPEPGSKHRDRYFVIAGVVIPEGSWHGLRDGILGMKLRRKIRGEIKWRHFAGGNQQTDNPLRNLSRTERDEVRTEMFSILRRAEGLVALACVASIDAAFELPTVSNSDDLYASTYKPVTERFQYFLRDRERLTGDRTLGIVVCDHRGIQDDARLKRHHEKLLYGKSQTASAYGNLVESLFLQSSNLSVGIQAADLVAGAVWRRFEKDDTRWFAEIEPLFRRRGAIVEGYGLVRFPKATWR